MITAREAKELSETTLDVVMVYVDEAIRSSCSIGYDHLNIPKVRLGRHQGAVIDLLERKGFKVENLPDHLGQYLFVGWN